MSRVLIRRRTRIATILALGWRHAPPHRPPDRASTTTTRSRGNRRAGAPPAPGRSTSRCSTSHARSTCSPSRRTASRRTGAREQHQHDRRSARLELVRESRRRGRDDGRARAARGPNAGTPPAPAKWTLLREKSAGTNPGFTARDANGQTWFLQFDAPEFPEASTGGVEVMTRNCSGRSTATTKVETFITSFDLARVRKSIPRPR